MSIMSLSTSVGNYALPIILTLILIYGTVKLKGSVFGTFIDGAKDGIKTVMSIFPSLIGLVTAVEMFRASGALDLLSTAAAPIADLLHIPSDIMPLLILRPVSGSGAVALLDSLLQKFGPDSVVGRTASVICASGETMFYTSTLYFGSVGIKRVRHTLIAALIADFCGIMISSITVGIFFYG